MPACAAAGTTMRERGLCVLTGAEDALIVNNNAGAVFLTLAGLCRDRDVLVSRGQLVEIGGGFRIPDVLRQSGARLVEVGTTNRTHLRDFEEALSERSGAIMRIHSSNFRQIGFVTEPALAELAVAAHGLRARGWRARAGDRRPGQWHIVWIPTEFGLAAEPMVQASVRCGRGCGDLQRRQAAGRSAGGHHFGPGGTDRAAAPSSTGAGAARGQDDAGGAGCNFASYERGEPCKRSLYGA